MSEDQYQTSNQFSNDLSASPFGVTNQQVKKVDLNYTVIFKALCSNLEQREPKLTDTEKFIMNA